MLLIEDNLVPQSINLDGLIELMEKVFSEEAEGRAVNAPRLRYRLPKGESERVFMSNIICGASESLGVAAVRYDATVMHEFVYEGGTKRTEFEYSRGRSWGFVILSSLKTGEPLSITHDFSLSPMRVAATTAIAMRKLARRNSKVVGLFGSGNEAKRNIEAICRVRDIEEVRVFSPNEQHREKFSRDMGSETGIRFVPVNGPEGVVTGSDIIMCATNSSEPVFDGNLLEEGQTLATIGASDVVHRRREADDTAFLKSDRLVLNSFQTALTNRQSEITDLVESGRLDMDRVHDLGDVLIGKSPGRSSDKEIIYYNSNAGVGIQFAATCYQIYKHCLEKGLGREIPTEWFGADVSEWLRRGYAPSP